MWTALGSGTALHTGRQGVLVTVGRGLTAGPLGLVARIGSARSPVTER